jgi:hypothetical protein
MNDFFNTKEPYKIANLITNNHELSGDLVSHVYFIMLERKDFIKDKGAFFASVSYKQWKLPNSDFNRIYRQRNFEYFDETHSNEQDEVIIADDRYKEHLHDYINAPSKTPEEWFVKEVAYLWIQGMTYREIESKVKLNIRYVTETIKQFKHDLYNSYHRNINGNDTDNAELDAEH